MKQLVITTLFTFFAAVSFAQQGTVTATVVDADSNQGIAGAVVEVAPAQAPDPKIFYTTG